MQQAARPSAAPAGRAPGGGGGAAAAATQLRRPAARAPRCRVWSREPDAWDALWEQEEAARRAALPPDDVTAREGAAAEAAARAAARAEADALHRTLLERQQRRDALRDRWVDACCHARGRVLSFHPLVACAGPGGPGALPAMWRGAPTTSCRRPCR
jgi:hypothetical protein